MNATQTQVLVALQQAGWFRDRTMPSVYKSFSHAAGGTTARVFTHYCQNRDAVVLESIYSSDGRNILATLTLEIGQVTPEEVADAVRNYVNSVTKEIANSCAMRPYVMPGWWIGHGRMDFQQGARMLVRVQASRPSPDCLVYIHPSSRTPVPCQVETFRSWATDYLGECIELTQAAEIDKAWGERESASAASQRLFRHIKSGGIYEFVSEGKLEVNQEPVVIYRKADNPDEVWVRPHGEFFDGRFEELRS